MITSPGNTTLTSVKNLQAPQIRQAFDYLGTEGRDGMFDSDKINTDNYSTKFKYQGGP